MTSRRPVAVRASSDAVSLASEPLSPSSTRSRPAGAISTSASSNATRASLIDADETWLSRPTWSRTAATTAGWRVPDGGRREAAGQVDEPVAVRVGQDRAERRLDDERCVVAAGPRAGALDRPHPLDDRRGRAGRGRASTSRSRRSLGRRRGGRLPGHGMGTS